jgi:hypothetical protein
LEAERTGYLDKSVINAALALEMSGGDLAAALRRNGYFPLVGHHLGYEIARDFQDPDDSEAISRGRRLFAIVAEMEAPFAPPQAVIVEHELADFRDGKPTIGVLNEETQREIRKLVTDFAAGHLGWVDIGSIIRREDSIRDCFQAQGERRVSEMRAFRMSNPQETRRLRSFEAFVEYASDQIPSLLVRSLAEFDLDVAEAQRLTKVLDRTPCIRSILRANLHLQFLCLKDGNPPARDRVYDYRHIIGASHCDVLISHDNGQRLAANDINPDLGTVPWSEIDVTGHGQI